MQLAVAVADYTPGEADQLRRDMAAWRHSGKLERHRDRLITRMAAKGIAPEFAERVYDQIRGFGEYGFPESHAASFALIAYATAWLKRHHPATFGCALLNSQPMGFYAPATIIDDLKRHAIEVRPIDVQRSGWDCSLEPCAPTANGRIGGLHAPTAPSGSPAPDNPEPFAVRMGLRYVKGMREEAGRRIEQERGRGPFAAADGLAARAGLDRGVLERLAQCGALESLKAERRDALWEVHAVRRESEPVLALRAEGPPADAGAPVHGEAPAEDSTAAAAAAAPAPDLPPVAAAPAPTPPAASAQLPAPAPASLDATSCGSLFEPLTSFEEIEWDYRASAHSTRGHPLQALRGELARQGLPDARTVVGLPDGRGIRYAGLVINRQRPKTAGGVVFMTLEDETGFVNLVLWRDVFARYALLAKTTSLLGVTGKVQAESGVVHVIVEALWEPRLNLHPEPRKSRDFR